MSRPEPLPTADMSNPQLAAAVARVKRRVLPLFVAMFIANYIDRVNVGFVRTHLEADVGIGVAAYVGRPSPACCGTRTAWRSSIVSRACRSRPTWR